MEGSWWTKCYKTIFPGAGPIKQCKNLTDEDLNIETINLRTDVTGQKRAMMQLLQKYRDDVLLKDNQLGYNASAPFILETNDGAYKYSSVPTFATQTNEYAFKNMLAKGVNKPSIGPWANRAL